MEIINFKGVRHNYNVYIENYLLRNISKYFNALDKKVFLIYDTNIKAKELNVLKSQIQINDELGIKAIEENKSIKYANKILKTLINKNYAKDDYVISFGGGIISDLVSFSASIYKRGINFISIPTTLLSMVDASIGSKNALNDKFKNIIGTFYDPKMVLIDPLLLISLPKIEILNGLCEVLKMGLIQDKSLVNEINLDIKDINFNKIIIKAIKVKEEFVSSDLFDENVRHALNFGHSFGHCYEIISNYQIKHGIAVALGMLKVSDIKTQKIITDILDKWNLKYKEYQFDDNKIKKIIKQDKKIKDNKIDLVILKDIGSFKIESGSIDEI